MRTRSGSESHLSFEELMLVAFGVVDLNGDPNPGRAKLASRATVRRIGQEIKSCEYCSEMAAAARLAFRPEGAGAGARPAGAGMVLPLRNRKWRGPGTRIAAAAAVAIFTPILFIFASGYPLLYALDGWQPVATGQIVRAEDAARRVTIYSGLRRTGEILVHPGARLTITSLDPGYLDMELHDGKVDVTVIDLDQNDTVKLRSGPIVAELVPDDELGGDLVVRMESGQSRLTGDSRDTYGGQDDDASDVVAFEANDTLELNLAEGSLLVQGEPSLEPTVISAGNTATIQLGEFQEASIEILPNDMGGQAALEDEAIVD